MLGGTPLAGKHLERQMLAINNATMLHEHRCLWLCQLLLVLFLSICCPYLPHQSLKSLKASNWGSGRVSDCTQVTFNFLLSVPASKQVSVS